jgi:hypothetical protein
MRIALTMELKSLEDIQARTKIENLTKEIQMKNKTTQQNS